jgi:steroid 5-alpha reductase family enzyme
VELAQIIISGVIALALVAIAFALIWKVFVRDKPTPAPKEPAQPENRPQEKPKSPPRDFSNARLLALFGVALGLLTFFLWLNNDHIAKTFGGDPRFKPAFDDRGNFIHWTRRYRAGPFVYDEIRENIDE